MHLHSVRHAALGLVFPVLLFFMHASNAQEDPGFNYALELNSDNDAYVVWENFDRFYTYGVGLKLSLRPERFLGLEKLFPDKASYFAEIQIRSEGYTPTKDVVSIQAAEGDSISFERPFAGLLFGKAGVVYVFKRSFVRAELLFGIMGPSALSKELQDWIHENITDDGLLDGWEFQVPDQPIVNINVQGAYDLMPNRGILDIYGMAEVRAGNLYIDATPKLGIRLGRFGPLAASSSTGTGVLAGTRIRELYLRSTFSATVALFDGTAQGNILDRDFEYAVASLNPFYLSMSHGIFFRRNRFSLGFDHVFNFGKVLKGVRHIYGRVFLEYAF